MADLPTVSVIIPAYNAERFLARAVQSVFATRYPEIDVLIVEDGSDDATVEIAERLCAVWPAQCRLLRHTDQRNHGVSASRNLGITASTSEWIAFLDADDIYLPHRFDYLARFMCKFGAPPASTLDAQIDAFYEMSEVRVESALETDKTWGSNSGAKFGIALAMDRAALLNELLQGNTWAISAVTVRRIAIVSVGMFDTQLSIAEDCHLWIRLAASRNVVAGKLDTPVSVYFRHGRNSFHFSTKNRVGFLAMAIDAHRCTTRLEAPRHILGLMTRCIRGYTRRLLRNIDQGNRRRLACMLASTVVRARRFDLLVDTLLLRSLLFAPRSKRV